MPTTRSVNLSKHEITNALLNKLSAINLARLRTTSKAMKTAIDSRKNLVNKIKALNRKQEQIRTLLRRPQTGYLLPYDVNHKNFRLGKIAAKYFQRYSVRGTEPDLREVAVYKMPAGQLVNLPMNGKIFHTRRYHQDAQHMKRTRKTDLKKNGNSIYFRTNGPGTWTFHKRRSEVSYRPNNPMAGDGGVYHYGVKLSNIFSKSNRKRIKAL